MTKTPEKSDGASTRLIPLRHKLTAGATAVLAVAVTVLAGTVLAGVAVTVLAGTVLAARDIAAAANRHSARRRTARSHGLATWLDTRRHLSLSAARRRARYTRPTLTRRPSAARAEVGILIGRHRMRRIMTAIEHFVLIVAPPQALKTAFLSTVIRPWPGPAFVTSTRANIITQTIAARMTAGEIWVCNPDGLGGYPSNLRWSPLSGCDNPATAIVRAGYLSEAALKSDGVQNATFWRESAARLLRLMLHAGALAGTDLRAVRDWIAYPHAPEPLRILAEHPLAAPGWADELRAMLSGSKDQVTVIAQHASGTLGWLADPAMAAMACPTPGTGLNLDDFVSSGDTIYMVGADRPQAPLGPFFALLAAALVETAKQVASSRPGHRLCPPMLMCLDELTNTCPGPMPRWSSELSGWGVTVVAAIQSYSQLEDRWGANGADSVWQNAGVKIVGGGGTGVKDLETVSRLVGKHAATGADGDGDPVLPPEQIRMLKPQRALLVYRSCRPLIVRLASVHDRPWHKHLGRRPAMTPPPAAATESLTGIKIAA